MPCVGLIGGVSRCLVNVDVENSSKFPRRSMDMEPERVAKRTQAEKASTTGMTKG